MTPRGMVGSLRTKWKGDLQVGRHAIQDNGTSPNDIVLPNDDLAVSRIHFRIIYQDGFSGHVRPDKSSSKRLIPKHYIEFFKIFSDRHLANHPEIPYLPTELRMLIISYLRKPRNFYIQDMGSIHGTFVKLKHNQYRKLIKGQTYQIGGTEIFMNIIDVKLPIREQQLPEEVPEEE